MIENNRNLLVRILIFIICAMIFICLYQNQRKDIQNYDYIITEDNNIDPNIVTICIDITDIDVIAKAVYGEARGCSKLQQSAVVWCILNRVDAGLGTIKEVTTAQSQFHGYDENNPVTDEIRDLVLDVIMRWEMEKFCNWNVGRTLPPEYLYFSASTSNHINVFRDKWDGEYTVWDWNCWNPYEIIEGD